MNRARLLSTDCTSGRLAEWGNRYLPAELTGSTLAYLSAMGAFSLTFDPFWAATAAVAGEATGFYGVMLVRQARRRQHTATHLPLLRVLVAALHDLMLEFGRPNFWTPCWCAR
ncbi:MAG: hypothetical protein IPM07_00235 [Anaerolineales bacterium]|nr:hypothetical protein [Anaerolineales bacterium]